MEDSIRNLEDQIMFSIRNRFNQLEKENKDNLNYFLKRVNDLEIEVVNIKGPLMDQLQDFKNESEGFARELNRLQVNYRDLVGDFLKTLDTKLK